MTLERAERWSFRALAVMCWVIGIYILFIPDLWLTVVFLLTLTPLMCWFGAICWEASRDID